MEKMKVILFTQRVEIIESYGERRDCADQQIAKFISECGYIPIPVPNNKSIVYKILGEVKPGGIVLTGGNSLVKYGGNAPERDETDKLLIDWSIANNVPLYGFCRGMQSVLDYYGMELENVEGHVAKRHNVCEYGQIINVNSYHNQACIKDDIGSELVVVARTEDGVIEEIKHNNKPIFATMWHPEREEPFNKRDIERMINIFN